MTIIDKITDALISDEILDRAYVLAKKRENIITNTGQVWHINSTTHRAIRDGLYLYLNEATPIKSGDIASHVDELSVFIITNIEPQAGRIKASLEELPLTVSLHQARTTAVNHCGQPCYSITPTNWTEIPASSPSPNVIRLPASYTPELGELLLTNGSYKKVIEIIPDGAVTAVKTEDF